ncbi:t-SNARE [Powellomyces hirtus]|nr:t-SNARE [Powellomyces hirtus]
MSRDRTADLKSTGPRYPNPSSRTEDANPAYRAGNSAYGNRGNGGSYESEMEMGQYPQSSNSQYSRGNYNEPPRETPRHQPAPGNYYNRNDSYDNSYNNRGQESRAYPQPTAYAAPARRGGNFFEEVEQTMAGIKQVRQNINIIEQLHQRALLATSPDEQAQLTRDVDRKQDETSDLIQNLRASVKKLNAETKNASKADAAIRQQQQAGLARNLMEVAQQYQEVQMKSKQKYRQRMEREIRIARPDATTDEIERALDSNTGSVFSQQLLSSRTGSQRAALAEVQNRHEEITRIEQSINELFNLFQEMQAMLEQQQETIDAIETHVDNTHVYVEDGNKEMTQAIVHRKASRKKAWWICFCVIFLLIILVVVLYIYVIKPAIDVKNATDSVAA